MREIYASSNSDTWHLLCDPTTGHSFVRHTGNESSGSHVTDISLPVFLGSDWSGPEHQALWRLIGALADDDDATPQTVIA